MWPEAIYSLSLGLLQMEVLNVVGYVEPIVWYPAWSRHPYSLLGKVCIFLCHSFLIYHRKSRMA